MTFLFRKTQLHTQLETIQNLSKIVFTDDKMADQILWQLDRYVTSKFYIQRTFIELQSIFISKLI